MSGTTSMSTPGATGQFQTYMGQVLDPDGAVFTAKGINVDASHVGDASQILADFPGLNFVRLNVVDYASPDAYAAFIKTMTSHGVVVELEDHTSSDGVDSGGARGVAFTGTELTNELNWYSSIASAYKSNPYVWLGTDNEPPLDGLALWQEQTYTAIRSMGNNNPIMLELPGGSYPNGQSVTSYGLDPIAYAKMSNTIGDVHLYGWSSNYAPDQQAVDSTLADMVRGVQTIPSTSGEVPVILGEYGPSTEGPTPDANANQVLYAAQRSPQASGTSGAAAFTWSGGGADTLSDGQGNLTPYGQEVAQWIASPPPSGAGATVSQADVSAATSGASMSFLRALGDAGIPTFGTDGNVCVLPAAGNGALAFTNDVLDTSAALDFRVALAAPDWNGAASILPGYLGVTDRPQGAVISIAATFDGSGRAIATIPNATSLDLNTLLAHSIT